MGLDMYLEKRHYVQRWAHQQPEKQFSVTVKRGDALYSAIKPERISYIIEQVAYWRKANAIHQWFVKNCQGGNDDCQPHYVSREQLKTLFNLAKYALTAKEPETVLPTQAGFFFGSTDYEEGYREDMENTVKQLTDILAEPESDAEFYYIASW